MKTLVVCVAVCLVPALSGCGSSSPTTGDPPPKRDNAGKPNFDPLPAGKPKKGKNPLVGKWVMTKYGTQDWSDKVTKDAVIEFHDEEPGGTPGMGKMTLTDKKGTGRGEYVYTGKDGFRFTIDIDRKDGSRNGGYGGLMQISKLTDKEIVGDLFTLKRVE